jgi:inositol oxygenase
MAPTAIADLGETVAYSVGQKLENLSDEIDEVNSIKYDSESKFDANKDKANFRQYEDACDRVKNFYKEQHQKQTVAYNLAARNRFHSASRVRPEMTIWEAMEKLNTLIDESDPDTSLSQIEHLLQSAEAIRRDGKPRWMQVTGLIHDLGKLMLFFEWAAHLISASFCRIPLLATPTQRTQCIRLSMAFTLLAVALTI